MEYSLLVQKNLDEYNHSANHGNSVWTPILFYMSGHLFS